MKCSICMEGLGGTWVCIAWRGPSGTIRVANCHTFCLKNEIGAPASRKLDAMIVRTGWVQEALPLGNLA